MRPRSTMLTPSSGSMTSLSASSTWLNSWGSSATAMVLAYVRACEIAIVALVLETVSQLGTALLGNAAVDEDVHEVRLDVAEDARVVRDEQDAEVSGLPGAVDALGDDLQRVDVKPGVRLIEHGEARLQEFHLEDLVALLLATREALVDVALGEGAVHPKVVHRRPHVLDPAANGRSLPVDRGLGSAEEVRDRDAGDLDGVLHREEEAGTSPLVDAHLEHVFTIEGDRAALDLVLGVSREGIGQRRFAGAVGAHDRVGLTRRESEVDALQDLLVALLGLDADVEIADDQF